MIIAVANQKGGVGKSTTTYHLAQSGAKAGKKVLIIDTDPQGNLTGVTSNHQQPSRSLADALNKDDETTLEDVIINTHFEGIDIAPSGTDALAFIRDQLIIYRVGRENRLKQALEPLKNTYDLILIDCGPAIDQLSINAMVAADKMLIITHLHHWSLDGLALLLQTISEVQNSYNPHLSIAGVAVNQVEINRKATRKYLTELDEALGSLQIPRLNPLIPKRAIIADTTTESANLYETERSLGALYDELLETITK